MTNEFRGIELFLSGPRKLLSFILLAKTEAVRVRFFAVLLSIFRSLLKNNHSVCFVEEEIHKEIGDVNEVIDDSENNREWVHRSK